MLPSTLFCSDTACQRRDSGTALSAEVSPGVMVVPLLRAVQAELEAWRGTIQPGLWGELGV